MNNKNLFSKQKDGTSCKAQSGQVTQYIFTYKSPYSQLLLYGLKTTPIPATSKATSISLEHKQNHRLKVQGRQFRPSGPSQKIQRVDDVTHASSPYTLTLEMYGHEKVTEIYTLNFAFSILVGIITSRISLILITS